MEYVLLALLLLLLVAAFALWQLQRRLRVSSGIPLAARVVYSDTGAWQRVERPLYSSRYLLTGKPDYIVMEGNTRIPIEVKPNRADREPRPADTLQLAAYCLLIEETTGARPPHGLLKYQADVFRIEFTDELRAELLAVIEEMKRNLQAENVARSHTDASRCRGCGYREECEERLG